MSRGGRNYNAIDIFTFGAEPADPMPSPKFPPTPSPSRLFSVRIGPTCNGKLTSGERLRMARTLNGQRLAQSQAQSLRRQKREREKAEAVQKMLVRRNEDPNLVYDLTGDGPLAHQVNQSTQPDELVSEDDEDEEDFAAPATTRTLFLSPNRKQRSPVRTKKRPKPLRESRHQVTEISDEENIPRSYLKKRRLTEPRKRISIPINSPAFAPNVRDAFFERTASRRKAPSTSLEQRAPLKVVECNASRKSSQDTSSRRELVRRERPQQSRNTSNSGEMILNISTIRATERETADVHHISDDDSYTHECPRQKGILEHDISRNVKASHQIPKRPRSGGSKSRCIPAKSFYGSNDPVRLNTRRKSERFVIPLLKGHGTAAPSEEISRLSLREQHSSRDIRRQNSHKRKMTRKVHHASSEEDDEATKSQVDIRFKALNGPELEVVRSLTFKVPKKRVMARIQEANIELKAGDFGCLRGSRWLNDEIMNSFVALINTRSRAQTGLSTTENYMASSAKVEEDDEIIEVSVANGKPMEVFRRPRPRTHVFNTFFYPRLSQHGYDYGGVKRWLKRAERDIRELDLILIPINLSNFHWVLAAIDLRGKQFIYFDSTCAQDSSDAIPLLRKWLCDEVADKHGDKVLAEMLIDTWGVIVNPSYLPEQKDGGSCGIFALYMAEYLERGRRPDFTQSNIRTLRQRTALFLKYGKLPE